MLRKTTEKYTFADKPAYEVDRGAYFPDEVIDGIAKHLPKTPLVGTSIDIVQPTISVEQSKAQIIKALGDISPQLGQKADEILNDPKRLNLKEVEAGTGRMMCCRPAGLTMERLQARGMDKIPEDMVEDFPQRDNPNDYAINEAGNNDNPFHMEEVQAYLTQSIVRDSLSHSDDPAIALAARQHVRDEMNLNQSDFHSAIAAPTDRLHDRPTSFVVASLISDKLAEATNPEFVIETVMGRYGAKGISESLAEVGVERTQDFDSFLHQGFSNLWSNLKPEVTLSGPAPRQANIAI